ncbi:hypothetical protein NDU88_011753 [Pleurodeles waltl]|uniref:Uncharacterized protein n=1 Tax=Pleurodeles waltl TaxID=8319 RepID=A0AAV7QY63_PLEWA|nr:hypothetical protein NDU88_011753 [Pleurodeles waltl]
MPVGTGRGAEIAIRLVGLVKPALGVSDFRQRHRGSEQLDASGTGTAQERPHWESTCAAEPLHLSPPSPTLSTQTEWAASIAAGELHSP